MTSIPHCSMDELRRHKCVVKWVDELRDEVAAMLIDGNVVVRSSVCPNLGGEFKFSKGKLVCKWHGWEFDGQTGSCTNFKVATELRAYPFELENDVVVIKAGEVP